MERTPEQIFNELLVIRCQANDKEAQGLLWKRWQPKVLKWSYDFIKDQDLAYEIAQEGWISIFKGINKLKDVSLFRFWAYRIVQRRAADWIRKEQRQRAAVEVNTNERDQFENIENENKLDSVDLMLRAIKSLPNDHQQMLRMFYLEKTPVKVMAKLLSKPEGTIKSRLYHAREQLKKKLNLDNHG
jgi:RNA polymerase sigma factor (sigma-70 family)